MFFHRLFVVLAGAALLVLVAMSAAPRDQANAAAEDAPHAVPIVAFIGDSYTSGTGASSLSSRWSTLASERLGWDEVNLALSGTGYIASSENRPGLTCELAVCLAFPDMLEQRAPASADIVVIAGGINDARFVTSLTGGIGSAASETFDDVCTAFPDARQVIVLAPFWPDGTSTADLERIRTTIHRVSDAHGFTFVADASSWLTGTADDLDPDGLHPNDRGHAALAARFVDAVERAQAGLKDGVGGCRSVSAIRSAS